MLRIIVVFYSFFLLMTSCSNDAVLDRIPLYVGTSGEGGRAIFITWLEPSSGSLFPATVAAFVEDPNFLTISLDGKYLWATGKPFRNDSFSQGALSAFNIDKTNYKLSYINSQSSGGNYPCFISADNRGERLFCANYGSGNITMYPLLPDGKIGEKLSGCWHSGSGSNKERQEGAHAHSIVQDLQGKFVYAADLGADKIFVYDIKGDSLSHYKSIEFLPGSGPRHIDFHPKGKSMVVVNELSNTIGVLGADSDGCFSNLVQSVSTLPDDFQSFSKAADIHFSPDGKFVYASNRGFNSIAVFEFNEKTELLVFVQFWEEDINWPRNFTLSPDGKFLLVANRNGNNIVVFPRDEVSGKLSSSVSEISIVEPVCLKFIYK